MSTAPSCLYSQQQVCREVSAVPENLDALNAVQYDVERAIELYIQLGDVGLGSMGIDVDGGSATARGGHRRGRRRHLTASGQHMVSVLPGGTLEQTMTRTGRRGGFPESRFDGDVFLWRSTFGRKLGRLDLEHRHVTESVASMAVCARWMDALSNGTDSLLCSASRRRGITLMDVRMAIKETNDALVILRSKVAPRSWRGDAQTQLNREQGFRRTVRERLIAKRGATVHQQEYTDGIRMLAMVCARDQKTLAYCLRYEPN